MKRFFILLTAILIAPLSNAQQIRWFKTSDPAVTINGIITDEITGEGICSAAVVANGDAFNCVFSDSDGGYSIKVIPGDVELTFSAIGYKGEIVGINTEVDTTVNCVLRTEPADILFYSHLPKRFEFDARCFNTFGFTNVLGIEQTIIGLEGRYNFRRFPIDIGLNFSYSLPFRMDFEPAPDTPVGEVINFSYWVVQAVTDYNYYRWHKIAPYVGLGIGAGKSSYTRISGYTQDSEDEYPYAEWSNTKKPIAIFSLRAGFEICTNVKIFFEQHFNTDKSRGSYFGLTYVL